MRRLVLFLSLGMLLLGVGCATTADFITPVWYPGRIAVLPFSNITADADAGTFARVLLQERLQEKGFSVIPLETVDQKLVDLGITAAGQLETVSTEEFYRVFNADSFLYGDVREAKRIMLGFYFSRSFRATFKILDARTGNLMWQDERSSSETKFTLSLQAAIEEGGKEIITELAHDAILRLMDSHPLIKHIRRVVNRTVRTLPTL